MMGLWQFFMEILSVKDERDWWILGDFIGYPRKSSKISESILTLMVHIFVKNHHKPIISGIFRILKELALICHQSHVNITFWLELIAKMKIFSLSLLFRGLHLKINQFNLNDSIHECTSSSGK